MQTSQLMGLRTQESGVGLKGFYLALFWERHRSYQVKDTIIVKLGIKRALNPEPGRLVTGLGAAPRLHFWT